MQVTDILVQFIFAAHWNANEMDDAMLARLRNSIQRFGLVTPLVVRKIAENCFETVGGAQRLATIKELAYATAPCVIVDADDGEARLLAQALNHIAGEDNPGLRGEVLRCILETVPESEVAGLLPGSWERLKDLTQIGQEDMAAYLNSRLQTQGARLEHMVFQLSREQLDLVRTALRRASGLTQGLKGQNPNHRGNALAAICKKFLEGGNCNE